MSDYQLWSEQPVLWWLTAAISPVLIILFYGTFRLFFQKFVKKKSQKSATGGIVFVRQLLFIYSW